MATTYYNDIQKLYVAYFNRPADTAGLAYWETVVEGAKGSTTAVSAAFAASAEYKAAYAGMANADIVNQVYLNLFGRAAEQAGKDYWGGLLDAKKITIDAVVTQIASGAQGSDLTAYNDKVAASVAFTSALGTTNAYSGANANVVAKQFLTGVTDNGSLASATDPYALGATVAKVNAAGTTFSLQTGLAALTAANTAHTNFLAAADGDNDATTSTTDAAITANVGTKAAAVGTIINAVDTDVPAGTYIATTTSAAVKAALITEAQANLAANLAAAQNALSTANTNVAKVAGLSDAIATLTSAKAAATAAATADTAAHTDVAVKVAAYNVQNTTGLVAADSNYATVVAAAAGVITTDSKGNLVLATGVTETNHPGVTALLNSLVAEKSADSALQSANTAKAAAQTNVDFLDLNATAKTDLANVASAMTIVKLAAGTTPSQAQITTEQSSLHALYLSDKAISDAMATTDAGYAAAFAATAAAATADTNFAALVTTLNTDVAADGDPLATAVVTATGNVKTATDAITALNKALADLATATTVQTQLNSVNGQINAAKQAFVDNGLLQPVTLDSTHVSNFATAGADIYVAGKTNASITNFGLLGGDSLFIGSGYTLNTTGDITKGNDAVLEAFIIKSGTDTKIVLEQKAFASSEAGGLSAPDLVTITLTGVDSTKVHVTNGIVTVS